MCLFIEFTSVSLMNSKNGFKIISMMFSFVENLQHLIRHLNIASLISILAFGWFWNLMQFRIFFYAAWSEMNWRTAGTWSITTIFCFSSPSISELFNHSRKSSLSIFGIVSKMSGRLYKSLAAMRKCFVLSTFFQIGYMTL